MSCIAAMDDFSAVGAAGRHHGHPHRRGAGDDLAAAASIPMPPGRASPEAQLQPRHARRLRARLDLQAVHRRNGDGPRRHQVDGPDVQLPRCAARSTAPSINDTHPFGRPCTVAEIMKESSNIGTAQIAAQVGGTRQKAFLEKMGFLEPVEIELKERGRTLTPGNNWGPLETMTVGYGHGIAVTPLHLASGYATLFNGGIYRPATLLKVDPQAPRRQGPARVQRGHQLQDARAAAAGRHQGHRQEGRRARLSRRRQDRLGGEISQPLAAGHDLRRRFPDGRTPLCDRRHARRTQGDRRNLRLPHRRLERRAGGQQDRQPDRADARRRAATWTASRTWPRCCPSFTKRRNNAGCACASSRASTAIPK